MKRSVINTNIEWAMDLCKELHFNLPDFAYWTPEDWEAKKDITLRFRGSSNQRIIDVKKSLETGEVVLWEEQ